MKNEFIESYIKFLNLKCDYTVDYLNDYTVRLIDANNNFMDIINIFEDVLVSIDNVKIGCFRRSYDRIDNSEIWVLRA